jgi:excisionase family DNA binding protein
MRLINLVEPYPMESLDGHFERLQLANYYEKPLWYHQLLQPSKPPLRPNMLSNPTHYQALAELTGLSIDTLYAHTLHRFAKVYSEDPILPSINENFNYIFGNPQYRVWDDKTSLEFTHRNNSRKICPHCIEEIGTYYLHWSLSQVTLCSIHRAILIDHCPNCYRNLRIDLSRRCCLTCRYPISHFETTSISDHRTSTELSLFMEQALGINNLPISHPLPAEHPLNYLSSATLLRFFWYGGKLLYTYSPKSPLFMDDSPFPNVLPNVVQGHTLTKMRYNIKKYHNILIGMWHLIQDWPYAWYIFLEQAVEDENTSHSGRALLPNLLEHAFPITDEWIWLHQGWANFMQTRIFTSAVVSPWLRPYRERQQYQETFSIPVLLSRREAAKELGVSENTIKEWIANGQLRTIALPGQVSERQWQLVDFESIRQLQAARNYQVTLAQVANMIDTSEEQVVALVKAGLLQAENGPLIDEKAIWRFSLKTLQTDLNRLLGEVPLIRFEDLEQSKQYYNLAQVQKVMSGVGFKLTQLLLAIQNGQLPAYRGHEDLRISSLRFDKDAVSAYVITVQQSKRSGLISSNEVYQRLHCKKKMLDRFAELGLLIPLPDLASDDRRIHWYAGQDVDAFLERYITCEQAAEIVGCTPVTIQKWARLGRLISVTGPNTSGNHSYRFEKAALIQWRQERLTVGEALKILQVSRATIDRWVQEGRLTPLADMGGKQRWFARAALQQLLDGKSERA